MDADIHRDEAGLASLETLRATWERMVARREVHGRRAAVGVDGVRGETFQARLDENLREVARMLARRDADGEVAYRFGPLASRILVTATGKHRPIYVPRARDQVVLRVLTDHLAAGMRRRGIAAAPPPLRTLAQEMHRAARSGDYRYALRADIASFYPSVPHEPILAMTAELGLHRDALTLVRRLLRCEIRGQHEPRGSGAALTVGVPTGVSTSNLLGELLLARVDAALADGTLRAFRFVDDILVLARDLTALQAAETRLREALDALGLRLSESKLARVSLEVGARFVGFDVSLAGVQVCTDRIDRWVAARSRTLRNAARAIAEASSPVEAEGLVAALVLRLNRDLSGLRGHLVPQLGQAGQIAAAEALDQRVRTLLGGIFRRTGLRPTGPFRVASARDWAYRWQRSPLAARRAAERLFPLPPVASKSAPASPARGGGVSSDEPTP
jgi:RNA-directed DNA polymerase